MLRCVFATKFKHIASSSLVSHDNLVCKHRRLDDANETTHSWRGMCKGTHSCCALPLSLHTLHVSPPWEIWVIFWKIISHVRLLFAVAVNGTVPRRCCGPFSVKKKNAICEFELQPLPSSADTKKGKQLPIHWLSILREPKGRKHILLAEAELDRKLTHHQPATKMK